MNNHAYVYILLDPITNEPFYVGKGHGGRAQGWLTDKKINPVTSRISDIRKTGGEPIIEISELMSEDDAWAEEKALIASIGRVRLGTGPLLNKTSGGDGGSIDWSDESREKLSNTLAEYWTEEKKLEMSEKQKQIWTDEKRQEASELSHALLTPEFIQNIKDKTKEAMTPEVRAKAADKNRGRTHTPEAIALMKANYKNASTPESRKKQAESLKAFHARKKLENLVE